jgi:hypothetical protein
MVDRPPPQPADDDNTKAQQRRSIWKRAGPGLLVLGLLTFWLACAFLFPILLHPSLSDSDLTDVTTATTGQVDAAKVQELKDARKELQNAARASLLQGFGPVLLLIGAAFAARMTFRQVQATREQIRETATASRNQLKLSEQGQVTDRYTKAVDQLGHEKAPVRLGALHSLERLAQGNPEYRQTVVDVFCAYLRMPYSPPARSEPGATRVGQGMAAVEDGIPTAHPVPGQSPAQEELQVRQTAQRLLAYHLRCPTGISSQDAQLLRPSPQQEFWPGISLDLTGATLVNLSFGQVSVIQARFVGTTFQGGAWLTKATFEDDAFFNEATFEGPAWFNKATFQDTAGFAKATFEGNAWFDKATFEGPAWFTGTTFQNTAWFDKATFEGNAWFRKATFQGLARFTGAHVLYFDDPDRDRVWPDGWIVRQIPTDSIRGTLVRAEQAEEPEPAVPHRTKLADSRLAGCPRVRRSPGVSSLLFAPVRHA